MNVGKLKETKLILVGVLIFLVFYILFVMLNLFPYKYSLVESSGDEDQIILQHGLWNKEMIAVSQDSEIRTLLITSIVQRIDGILTLISLLLAATITIILGLTRKEKDSQPYLISLAVSVPPLIYFLMHYYQLIHSLELFLTQN